MIKRMTLCVWHQCEFLQQHDIVSRAAGRAFGLLTNLLPL